MKPTAYSVIGKTIFFGPGREFEGQYSGMLISGRPQLTMSKNSANISYKFSLHEFLWGVLFLAFDSKHAHRVAVIVHRLRRAALPVAFINCLTHLIRRQHSVATK